MFGCSLMEMWTMDICEGRSWSLYVPQSPVSWIVTRTCTHLMERGYLLLHFHDYLLSCVFAAIWQILRGGSHRLQSNQLKTRKNFLPQRGIEPRTFQSWVFCLAIWAITPRRVWCSLGLWRGQWDCPRQTLRPRQTASWGLFAFFFDKKYCCFCKCKFQVLKYFWWKIKIFIHVYVRNFCVNIIYIFQMLKLLW